MLRSSSTLSFRLCINVYKKFLFHCILILMFLYEMLALSLINARLFVMKYFVSMVSGLLTHSLCKSLFLHYVLCFLINLFSLFYVYPAFHERVVCSLEKCPRKYYYCIFCLCTDYLCFALLWGDVLVTRQLFILQAKIYIK